MKVTIRQKSGMQYLFADISVSGIRTKCSLGISVKVGKFNPKTQGVQGESDCETNILINKFKSEIMELVRRLQHSGNLSSFDIGEGVKEIRERLTNPSYNADHEKFLCAYAELHISRSHHIKKKSTIKQYQNCLNQLRMYEKTKRTRMTFETIDLIFYDNFISFCQRDLNLSTNSIGKLIKNIKLLMNLSLDEGLHTNTAHKSRSFKKPIEETEAIYLSIDELEKLNNVILPPYYERVRDLFLIGCYTGLRFQDYDKVNKDHFIKDGTMLKVRTEKTDEEVIIPLHPVVKRVIEKYNGTPQLISNQKFNKYIKEICRIVGIDERISIVRTTGGKKTRITKPKHEFVSSHTARRSFATNAYKAGVQSLAIMAITGHRTEKVFLKYIRVTKEEHAELTSKHQFFMGRVG